MDEKVVVTSRKYTLNWLDAGKGLVMAILTAVLMAIESSLEAGEIEINYKKVAVAGSLAAIAYLLKNFFTPSEIKTPAEPKKS
jgi:hypothetical protein